MRANRCKALSMELLTSEGNVLGDIDGPEEGELDIDGPEEGELDIDGTVLTEGPCREQKYYK